PPPYPPPWRWIIAERFGRVRFPVAVAAGVRAQFTERNGRERQPGIALSLRHIQPESATKSGVCAIRLRRTHHPTHAAAPRPGRRGLRDPRPDLRLQPPDHAGVWVAQGPWEGAGLHAGVDGRSLE